MNLLKSILLTMSILLLVSGCGGTTGGNPSATVTLQSAAYTNNGTVVFFLKPQLDKIASLFIAAPMAAAVTDLKFCITEMKIVKDGESTEGGAEETSLGLVLPS